jgi:hypothetical protein
LPAEAVKQEPGIRFQAKKDIFANFLSAIFKGEDRGVMAT